MVCTCEVSFVSCMMEGCSFKAPSLSLVSVPSHLFFLYTALLRPCLEHATIVWDDCFSHDSNSLERIQLRLHLPALLCLFIQVPTLPHPHCPRCLSLLLAGRPSPGGDGAAASYWSSGSSSTDSVLPVSKRSSPLHPPGPLYGTACETPNLWKSLCAPLLPICLPSCLLAQSFGTLFLPLPHLALHCLHLPLLLTLSSWMTSFLMVSHLNYS